MSTVIVLCTAPDSGATEEMVRKLVEEGVVACGNIVPDVNSIYRWKGNVEAAAEALIIFKTTEVSWPRLMQRLPELHPYDVPELLLLKVADGLAPYLNWVEESTAVRDHE
jgi:periplasmic divalent cation tolerance protein